MKKVLVFGTYDIFHKGHEYFLKEAKKKGDKLIVVVARDSTVSKIKEKQQNNERFRVKVLRKKKYIDKVVMGNKGKDKLKIVFELKPDIICLGYDQKHFVEDLKEYLEKKKLKVKIFKIKSYMPRKYKSTILRNKTKKKAKVKKKLIKK